MAKNRSSQRRNRPTSRRGGGGSAAQPFSLLIKPASGECNLRCDYCFYLEKCDLFPSQAPRRMSRETLQAMLESYFATPQPVYTFAWQGGEPTLMGLDFFEEVVELQRELAPPGARVTNGLQTNGTRITEELAQFFARNKFLIGISIDGPAEIHDRYRIDRGGGPTHHLVIDGLRRLRDVGVEVNVLTVVNSLNAAQPSRIYQYLKEELGFRYHQYIPLVEWDADGALRPFAITGDAWGSFLNGIFDEWYPRDIRRVSVRHFDAVMQLLAHGTYAQCIMAGRCNSYMVVEHNGDIYPCDFYVEPELRLGSVNDDDSRRPGTGAGTGTDPGAGAAGDRQDDGRRHGAHQNDALAAAHRSPEARRFAANKSKWGEECSRCPYLPFCSGDCPKMRVDGGTSHLCAGWKSFYSAHLDQLRELARQVPDYNGGIEAAAARLRPEDPCFCGSGKRYGNCHGARRDSG